MDSCFWRSVLQQVLYQIRWNALKVGLKIYTSKLKFLLNFFLWTHFLTFEKKCWWNMNFRRNNTSIFTSTRLVFNSKCLFKGGRKGLVMGCMWLRRRHLRIAPIQERLDGASDSAEASCDAWSQPHDITVYMQSADRELIVCFSNTHSTKKALNVLKSENSLCFDKIYHLVLLSQKYSGYLPLRCVFK